MTPGTLALVLLSATLHATWNLWAKQIGGSTRATSFMWLLEVISALAYLPVIVFRVATAHVAIHGVGLAWMGVSSLIHVAYFLLLLRGYRSSDLSVVYPVARGLGPLLAAGGAMLWLGERATFLSISGALLVATGVVVLTARPEFRHAPHLRTGIFFGAMVGVTIGFYTLWDGRAVSKLGLDPLLYYWGGEVCRVFLMSPFAARDRAGVASLWREHRARVIGIALLSPLSYVLVLIAMRGGGVSHIAPVREVSILIGTWFGARLLKEGDRTRRLVAATAFAAGVIALAFA